MRERERGSEEGGRKKGSKRTDIDQSALRMTAPGALQRTFSPLLLDSLPTSFWTLWSLIRRLRGS